MKDRIAGAIAAIRRAPNAPSVAAGLCVVVFVVGLWLWRIEHGVDLSDESLYLAFPMRFALGDRPFLDDRGLGQGAGLLVTPIVFLYHLVVRSNAGLVLFMRGCYLGFLLVVGASMARAVRGWISPAAALACGAITCFYVPYTMAQFSYNTLGGGLALLAMASSLRVARSTNAAEAARFALLVGVAAAGSALSYPTLAALFPVHFAGLLFFGRTRIGGRALALRFVIGAAIVGAYVLVFLLRSGFGSLRLTLEFMRAWGPSPATSVKDIAVGLNNMKTDWFTSLALTGALTAFAMRFRAATLLLAIAVPFLAAPTMDADVADPMRFFSCCALFAPFFAVLVRDRRAAFRVLAIVWMPAMLTGLVTACSSSNKWNAAGIGGFSGMIATVLLAARACEESVGRLRLLAPACGLVPPVVLVYVLAARVVAPSNVYREVQPAQMTARVRSGPFLGLRTSEKRRDLVEQMHADITAHVASSGARFVLFLPDMPSGYLSANARPAVPELWSMAKPGQSTIDAQVFRERLSEIGLVVVRSCEPSKNWQRWEACTPTLDIPNDPLQAVVLETFTEVLRRPDYTLLRRR